MWGILSQRLKHMNLKSIIDAEPNGSPKQVTASHTVVGDP